jgi:hypothetical protein
MQDKL